MINYAVKADFPKKHFWTLFIWKDRDSMRRFVMAKPHATAMKKFEEWVGDGSAFVEWTSPSNSIDWAEAIKRLEKPSFYYKKANLWIDLLYISRDLLEKMSAKCGI